MTQEINVIQQISVNNGNFNFPNKAGGKFGQTNQTPDQVTPYGAMPALSAITTGQGTLLDLSALSVPISGGGWCLFFNADPLHFVIWGVDDGSGNLKEVGSMLPGEYAGPFRVSPNQQKFRFKGNTAAVNVVPFFAAP